MDTILHYFPLVLYLLGTVLLVILIILAVKAIITINKANIILEDAYNRTKSLNKFFHIIDGVTDTLSSVSDSMVVMLTSVIGKLFNKKNKKEMESENDE